MNKTFEEGSSFLLSMTILNFSKLIQLNLMSNMHHLGLVSMILTCTSNSIKKFH